MPRFFFDIAKDRNPHPFGLELRDLDTARHVALKTACGMVQERTADFWENGGEWKMTVSDSQGALFTITFCASEAPVARHG